MIESRVLRDRIHRCTRLVRGHPMVLAVGIILVAALCSCRAGVGRSRSVGSRSRRRRPRASTAKRSSVCGAPAPRATSRPRLPDLRALLEQERGLRPTFTTIDFATGAPPPDETRELRVFGGVEYAKDALLPILESAGDGAWAVRLDEVVDDAWRHGASRPAVEPSFTPAPRPTARCCRSSPTPAD